MSNKMKLGIDEVCLISEAADLMNIEMPELKGKTQKQFGLELAWKMFKKMHKAREQIKQLLKNVTGKEVANMNVKEIIDSLTEVFKQEGVIDFFTRQAPTDTKEQSNSSSDTKDNSNT